MTASTEGSHVVIMKGPRFDQGGFWVALKEIQQIAAKQINAINFTYAVFWLIWKKFLK